MLLQGLPFWHQKSIPKSCFFKTPYFWNFMLILYEINRFVDPFKIQGAPKWDSKSAKWCKAAQQRSEQSRFYRYMFAICFSEVLGYPTCTFWTAVAMGSLWGFFLINVGLHFTFYLISLSIALVLERRCHRSWVLWKCVSGTPERITIHWFVDLFKEISCHLVLAMVHWHVCLARRALSSCEVRETRLERDKEDAVSFSVEKLDFVKALQKLLMTHPFIDCMALDTGTKAKGKDPTRSAGPLSDTARNS